MIEHVHEHIIEEVKTNTRTDTIFVLTSILLNLVVLAINSALGSEDEGSVNYLVMAIFTLLLVVVNLVAIFGLFKGRQTRQKLVDGLLRIYQDNGVDGYYDRSLLESYRTRYLMFIMVVVATGVVGAIVPFFL